MEVAVVVVTSLVVVVISVVIEAVEVCLGFSGTASSGFVRCDDDDDDDDEGETGLRDGRVSEVDAGVGGTGLFRVRILFCGEGDFAADSMSSLRFREGW